MNHKIIFTIAAILISAAGLAVLGLTRLTNSAPVEKNVLNTVGVKEETVPFPPPPTVANGKELPAPSNAVTTAAPTPPDKQKTAEIKVNANTATTNRQTTTTAPIPREKTIAFSDEVFNGEKIVKSEAEWRQQLTAEQFYVLREKGTEEPETGKYTHNKQEGVYYCGACGLALFSSAAKYDSETGWASFYQPIAKANILEEIDNSLEETRTEVSCPRCHSHLGHVFDDGPEPTGLRYCINSIALNFKKQKVRSSGVGKK